MPHSGGGGSSGWMSATKTKTFTGAADNGAVGNATFFTITGLVQVRNVVFRCTADLTEAGATATIALGFIGQTAPLLAQVNATTIDTGQWSSRGAAFAAVPNTGGTAVEYYSEDDDIIATIGAQAINGGTLIAYLEWRPVSAGATLVAA